MSPSKISPSKRAFEKYKARGLFSEFYGILSYSYFWTLITVRLIEGGHWIAGFIVWLGEGSWGMKIIRIK